MSTYRQGQFKSGSKLSLHDQSSGVPGSRGEGLSHAQSQTFLDKESPIDFSGPVGSDGDEIKSPMMCGTGRGAHGAGGVNSHNSNDSVPVRSAQDQSQQSFNNYDFLYDPEMAASRGQRDSSASHKLLSDSSLMAAQSNAMSPHVFMLSQDAASSATPAPQGGIQGVKNYASYPGTSGKDSEVLSQGSGQQQLAGGQATDKNPPVSHYEQQRASLMSGDQQDVEYVEEVYYVEEEVDCEEGEEEEEEDPSASGLMYQDSHCVETIKEVSSDQENQSLGTSDAMLRSRDGNPSAHGDAMGTIMQTASLSAGKQGHYDSNHFSRSQKAINASDFKDMRALGSNELSDSSKRTDSNMNSLVFKPRDSDAALFTSAPAHSVSLNSTKNDRVHSHQKTLSGDTKALQMHQSHPSFGASNQATLKPLAFAEKWGFMAEKCINRLHAKDLFVRLNKINEVLQRKQVQQEVILSNASSQMQLKSFLDISMNSSFNVAVQDTERKAINDELREKNLPQIQTELCQMVERMTGRMADYFQGEASILQSMAQERERNQFLESELSAREDRMRPLLKETPQTRTNPGDLASEADLIATEHFINELETQLSHARQELLSAKLSMSDQNVEIENLKLRLANQSNQVNQILEERRTFETSFEQLRSQLELLQSEKLELSQMIREREGTQSFPRNLNQTAPFSQYPQPSVADLQSTRLNQSYTHHNSAHQSSANLDLKRQVENLNKQVFEATKRQESLQAVETNLLEKLDRKDLENLELQEGLQELKNENTMKTQVIAKAQKIIERLTAKSDSDERVMAHLHEASEKLKKEALEKQKAIQSMNEQLREVSNKQTHDHSLMQQTMTRELEEVRNAVRDYQHELDTEKANYVARVTELQGQLSLARDETQAQRGDLERREEQTRLEAEASIARERELEEKLAAQTKLTQEIREEMSKQVGLVEESAQNQIKYLQSRIKEIVEETQSDTSRSGLDSQPRLSTKVAAGKQAGTKSLLTVVKKELESMCAEVLCLRESLRDEGNRKDALINQKMSKFDEFRLSVLDQLILWDDKTAELAGLADQYSGALDEQRKLFDKLRLVVNEKDQIIVELNRQLAMREQSQEEHFAQMKLELERSNQLMADEMLGTVALLEKKVLMKERQALQLEEGKIAFRKEYTSLLEEKNFYQEELQKTQNRLQFVESELERTQTTLATQAQTYGEILNIRTISIGQNTIEYALRNLADDAKRYQTEMVSLRDKLVTLEADRSEERALLNQKVASLTEQYETLQKQALDKEEEQSLAWVARENELIEELSTAQACADRSVAELQTRERQLKKMQEKAEEEDLRQEDSRVKIEIVAQEKAEALKKVRDCEINMDKLRIEIEQLEKCLDQKEDMLSMQRQDLQKERSIITDKIQRIHELETVLEGKEKELVNGQHSYSELESKLRHIEGRSTQTSKDLSDIYQELTQVKAARNELDELNRALKRDLEQLQLQFDKKQGECEARVEEISQYQGTVMRQTRELESEKGKQGTIEEQQRRLQTFDETMQRQAAVIDDLKLKLAGPRRQAASTQTVDSGMLELQYARDEVIKSQQCQEVVYQENLHLKETVQRSSYEVCRLIEDKRELEDLIEKLNKSIGQYRVGGGQSNHLQSSNLMASGRFDHQTLSVSGGPDVRDKVLCEKENYIGNLENEISDMRKEIELQREQLLQAEAQTICQDKSSIYMSLSGVAPTNTNYDQHHTSSYFKNQQPTGSNIASFQPSSPSYLQNTGLLGNLLPQSRDQQSTKLSTSVATKGQNMQSALRSTSQEGGHAPYEDPSYVGQPSSLQHHKLQGVTMNYSTLSRSLTPIDNITSSGSALKSANTKRGGGGGNAPGPNTHFLNNSQSMMHNQTQASVTQAPQNYGGHGIAPGNNDRHSRNRMDQSAASYLNHPNNQSSMMMGIYQTATGLLNQSQLSNDRGSSYLPPQGVAMANQSHFINRSSGSPPARDQSGSPPQAQYPQQHIHA